MLVKLANGLITDILHTTLTERGLIANVINRFVCKFANESLTIFIKYNDIIHDSKVVFTKMVAYC